MDKPTDNRDEPFAITPVAGLQQRYTNGGTLDADAMSREADIMGSFFRRLGAYVIDSIVLSGITLGGFSLLLLGDRDSYTLWTVGIIALLIAGFLYYWLTEAQFGATVGKWALGIRVVNKEGQTPGWRKSLVRNVVKVVEFSPFMLNGLVAGILVMALPSKQRLGDMGAGTYVLHLRDIQHDGGRKLNVMRTLLSVLSIAGVVGAISGIATAGQWIQSLGNDQTFQTADGQYEITVPSHWHKDSEVEHGLLIQSFFSNAYVYIEGATDEEQSEFSELEQYLGYVQSWIADSYSATLDDVEPWAIDLNGSAAYRFTMYGLDNEDDLNSYTVTVTGDEERYYFIISSVYDTNVKFDTIERFRRLHADDLAKLDKFVGSFKKAKEPTKVSI